jgi:beta-phosphoglucomutase-like phosphatase (HAD superfamily)
MPESFPAVAGVPQAETNRRPPYQGLIFDFDGTLADTMPLHWRAWQALIRRHGFKFSREQFYALGGIPSKDIIETINHEQGLILNPLLVAREKEEAYLALLDQVKPIEIIVQIAREHRGKMPQAVASGGTRRVIGRVLNHVGIADLFDCVVTSEDVTRQKPAPDIFLEAARRIGVPPALCRAYEDTDLGLRAIRAAGMEAIDVRPMRKEREY